MQKSLLAALAVRAAYLAIIVADAIRQDWSGVFFNGAVWLATLPLLRLGRWRPDFWRLDAAANALFVLAALQPLWELQSSVLGPDKAFHLLGGLILGYFLLRGLRVETNTAALNVVAAVAIAVTVATGWEVFEWALFTATGTLEAGMYADSMLDLVMGGAGALAGALAALKLK